MRLSRNKGILTVLLFASFLFPAISHAQKIDTISNFSVTAYVDAYCAHYSDSAGAGNFQKLSAVSPRSDAPSLNIAEVSFQYYADRVRAAAAFNFGDIAAANWPAEPYTHILEAHVGFKIYSKLWVDAGFFRGHFGTEFILPVENIATSLAVATYYEPVCESGVRLNFDPTSKLEINLFLLNGYNVYIDNNSKKSFGMGVTYALGNNLGIGYTNYIGDDTPDSIMVHHLRIAQNVFLNYQYKKIKLQAGGDYFLQQNADYATHSKMAATYSALATIRYQCVKSFAVYARGEFYSDPQGFMTGVITDNSGNETGYKLWGVTAGVEYKPTNESYVRLEGRRLQMDNGQYIFINDGKLQNSLFEIGVNAGVTFDVLKSVRTRVAPVADDVVDDGIK